jgi:hypothetical protein
MSNKTQNGNIIGIIASTILILWGIGQCSRRQNERGMTEETYNVIAMNTVRLRAVWARSDSAENLNTPIERLKVFARDDESAVRARVAANPNTPEQVLIELAKDSVQFVLISVARNPNTPVETLRALAEKGDEKISIAVANNPNAPLCDNDK